MVTTDDFFARSSRFDELAKEVPSLYIGLDIIGLDDESGETIKVDTNLRSLLSSIKKYDDLVDAWYTKFEIVTSLIISTIYFISLVEKLDFSYPSTQFLDWASEELVNVFEDTFKRVTKLKNELVSIIEKAYDKDGNISYSKLESELTEFDIILDLSTIKIIGDICEYI